MPFLSLEGLEEANPITVLVVALMTKLFILVILPMAPKRQQKRSVLAFPIAEYSVLLKSMIG